MYNIIEQPYYNNSSVRSNTQVSVMLNETSKPVITTTSAGYKIDCAKECPCGVPVIPVPDQWLEVMVTGGFKVWHIIFIIIALLVTIVVVYCCFHRCRIPRTKQEIEADLMRSNLTNKFRDYLQEFPNEPTTFMDALKRVQDLEEKSSEQDDMAARKRKGFFKLRNKDRQGPTKAAEEAKEEKPPVAPDETTQEAAGAAALENDKTAPEGDLGAEVVDKKNEKDGEEADKSNNDQLVAETGDKSTQNDKSKAKRALKSKMAPSKVDKSKGGGADSHEIDAKSFSKTKGDRNTTTPPDESQATKNHQAGTGSSPTSTRPARARRKRDKPNLSRTKASHVGSRSESMENPNVLTLPVASHHHHHQRHQTHQQAQPQQAEQEAADSAQTKAPVLARRQARSKIKETTKEVTIIQIDASPGLEKSKGSRK